MQIITVDKDRCVGCNACVRACPVHANVTKIKEGTENEFITTINPESCINCGECVKVCNHKARDYVDDFDKFKTKLENKERMILIVAPAIRTNFPFGMWKNVLSWIRKTGNVTIYDVGYGADICTFMHYKYLEAHPGKKMITQPCPAVVNYIEKYKPELIPSLSPILSPVGCLAVWLKKYKRVNDTLVMLSPCIAKTSEAEREHTYDLNVTFRNLGRYIEKHHVNLDDYEKFEFDELEGSIGRMYPSPGGLKATLQMLNSNLVIRNAEGPHNVYDAIARYGATEEKKKADILDVLNCQYGCNHGTATADTVATLAESESIMDDIAEKSIRETQGGFLGIGKMKRFKEFDKVLELRDFLTSYSSKKVVLKTPSPQDYQAIFNSMLKTTPDSHIVNCGACGYKSCTEMAYAIFNGMNVKENCVYYLKHSLTSNYSQLKQVYDECLSEIQTIEQISNTLNSAYQKVASASSDIHKKADELSGYLLSLKKLSENVSKEYASKQVEKLTAFDLQKLQKFIAAIVSMVSTYYEKSEEFSGQSVQISSNAEVMASSVDSMITGFARIQMLTQDF